ncbi:MAG TPA: DMT family transporter [Candidatus Limnocylindrales bacterium]|nr:DMT family transporter [Candidatus Limnocylindrales bacterium]
MEFWAILLVVGSSFIHAFWNLLTKKVEEGVPFLWWAFGVSLLVYAPLSLAFLSKKELLSPAGRFIFFGGTFEVAYFLGLSKAYARGDLSLVYPLARSAPIFVPIWATIFLKEHISWTGLIGILTVILGVFVVSLRWGTSLLSPELKSQPIGLALFTALASSGYSVVDKVGVSYMHPLPYIYLEFAVTWFGLGLYLLFFHRGNSLSKTWQQNKKSILLVGVFMTLSYLLILFALRIGKVSYVIALRQISIVFGVLLGSLILKEKYGKTRLLGALIIWLGAILISLAP